MTRLAGKVALVTGAAQGIGAGIARRFAAEGAAVVVHHQDDAAGAARVVADIVWRGGRAIAVQGDVARWPDVRRLLGETAATFGKLDILVNNTAAHPAGASSLNARMQAGDDAIRQQFETNLFGAMLLCQEAIRLFGAAGGSIINLTTLERCGTAPGLTADITPDAAIDTLTLGLARAFGNRNIRVNAIAPGVLGPEEPAAIDVIDGTARNRQFVALPALSRRSTPEAVARLAVALACDDTRQRSGARAAASRWH